ncbi:hypothetical protein M3A49_13785 [Paraburkholderia sp. CNPSo 3076]|uniref:hypothetical protein n=1 Tax=Paraburkholderia sp. CNPSo 3076 TaxID=2940936 RepID=UPI002255478B|nr:hypothetical protein [Paraburkholderia sp. CNPSo 3076]MCX5540552.1 hypothetical protein [Paraburkholderia sp. CNPSo 3076]
MKQPMMLNGPGGQMLEVPGWKIRKSGIRAGFAARLAPGTVKRSPGGGRTTNAGKDLKNTRGFPPDAGLR